MGGFQVLSRVERQECAPPQVPYACQQRDELLEVEQELWTVYEQEDALSSPAGFSEITREIGEQEVCLRTSLQWTTTHIEGEVSCIYILVGPRSVQAVAKECRERFKTQQWFCKIAGPHSPQCGGEVRRCLQRSQTLWWEEIDQAPHEFIHAGHLRFAENGGQADGCEVLVGGDAVRRCHLQQALANLLWSPPPPIVRLVWKDADFLVPRLLHGRQKCCGPGL